MKFRSIALAALVASFLLTTAPSLATEAFMRGMVVSCPRWGPIWGSPAMAESLGQLKEIGVDSVAIHPYGWIKSDGSIRWEPARDLPFLAKAVDLADDADIDLFWKPHLGYWGSFSHRGAIEFGNDTAAWARFFRDYQAFITDQASFAELSGIDVLAIGVELDRTLKYESLWRGVITGVRRVFSGRIVYVANWDRLEDVQFWDAVDLVGVHAYFPLSDADDPDVETINRGWDRHLASLERLSRAIGKPVLVAEIGYNTSHDAARKPWAYETHESPKARALRVRLIDTALDRLEKAGFIEGIFWWKWMPGNGRTRNFSMRDEEAAQALRRVWAPRGMATAK